MFEEDDWNVPPTVKPRNSLQAMRQIQSVPTPQCSVVRRNPIAPSASRGEFNSPLRTLHSASGSVPDCSHMDSNEALHQRLAASGAGENNFVHGNEKLFNRLLDDLDNISSSSNASARRRKKAKEIFTSWLFSPSEQRSDPATRRFTTDFTDYDFLNGSGVLSEDESTPRLSRDVVTRHSIDERTKRIRDAAPRRLSSGNVVRPKSARGTSEDETDSGYHTGNSTVLGPACKKLALASELSKKPAGIHTLTREQLKRRIASFNRDSHASHGLIIEDPNEDNTFQGAVRVHMNLIKPINMCTSIKPPSVYDTLLNETIHDSVQITSFYLPQDTTTVIHVSSKTTAPEVIRSLLSKFKITDSPRKFALYVKTEQEGKLATMQKMSDTETPLPLLLSWADEGIQNLNCNKIVLQENDAGEIMWDSFSLPELDRFLCVLNREENEYVNDVKTKYRTLRMKIEQRLGDISSTV